ncbi:S-protein homolog 24-like [Telopea speciosissima]|uniref:S-protein homolog 24-like n=1 Tax=Telopea speciosissima TaxID=54955 RepID=UPI001CC67333|nr:S-protein homolog 24-like [Telopea speciosissima]
MTVLFESSSEAATDLSDESLFTVSITNELGNDLNLNVHCQSNDTDLGKHLLPFDKVYSWNFNVKDQTTVFYCDLEWGNNVHAHFDAFVFSRDYFQVSYGTRAWWAKVDGVYSDTPDGLKLFYKWST